MRNERRSNGSARNKLRLWLKAQGRPCWICRAFGRSGEIDYSLPHTHPLAFEVDELNPVSRWREFGYPSPTACALDRNNVDAAHRSCNEWKGAMSAAEVLALAAGRKKRPRPLPTSRDWRRPFDG